MKKTILFSLFILSLIINVSCTKERFNDLPHDSSLSVKSSQEEYTASYSGMIVLGKKLPNPYALANMQLAYDSLMKTVSPTPVELLPTELYVRFLPKDSTDLRILWEDEDLVLFDYPLDYEITVEGGYYHDPDIPEDMPTWLYTAVPVDYVFPDVEYEILEECYIPDESKSRMSETSSVSAEDLERMAYKLVGLEDQLQQEPEGDKTKQARRTPKGRFQVIESSGNIIPLKGVMVKTHNVVKIAKTYTDENGYYEMPKTYLTKIWYSLVFKNNTGFSIWNNYNFVIPARCGFGRETNAGIDRVVVTGDKAWTWSVINNAVVDYFDLCNDVGILPPEKDLKIFEFDFANVSSAPMLNHGIYDILYMPNPIIAFFSGILGALIKFIQIFINFILPDVTIGTQDFQNNSVGIYQTVFHELSHASHKRQAGTDYWGEYISYIISYGAYGDGTGMNSGVCEVGEMWGYAMEQIHYYKNFQGKRLNGDYPGEDDWFKPQIYWDLIRDDLVTETQLFSYMTNEVRDLPALKSKIYANADKSKLEIAEIFSKYEKNDGKTQWVIKNSTDEDLQLYVSSSQFHIGNISTEKPVDPNPPGLDSAISVLPGTGGLGVGGVIQIENGYDEEPFEIRQEYTIAEFPDFYLSFPELIEYDEIRPNTVIIFDKRGEKLKEFIEGTSDYEKFFSESSWHKTRTDSLIQYTLEITDEILNAN